jgi:hypothetical protein
MCRIVFLLFVLRRIVLILYRPLTILVGLNMLCTYVASIGYCTVLRVPSTPFDHRLIVWDRIACWKRLSYCGMRNRTFNTPISMTLFLHFHSILTTGGCVHKHLHTPLTPTLLVYTSTLQYQVLVPQEFHLCALSLLHYYY